MEEPDREGVDAATQPLNRPAVEELRQLLREIRQLPAVQAISEDQVAEEIAEYRAGR